MKRLSILAAVCISSSIFAGEAVAVDYPLNSKFVCRLEEGEKAELLKAGSLKAANFAVTIKKQTDKIAALTNTLAELKSRGASKAKITAAKNKLSSAKGEKKLLTDCKKGKVDTTNPQPTPTPPGGGSTVAGSVEVSFALYPNGSGKCIFVTFGKWADVPGVTFNKIGYHSDVSSGQPKPNEVVIAPPYDDVYVDKEFNITETGITLTVEQGFHQVKLFRFQTLDFQCIGNKDANSAAQKANFDNVILYKAQ